jgi:hypothetical protein
MRRRERVSGGELAVARAPRARAEEDVVGMIGHVAWKLDPHLLKLTGGRLRLMSARPHQGEYRVVHPLTPPALTKVLLAAPEDLLALPLGPKLASLLVGALVPLGDVLRELAERRIRRRPARSGFMSLLSHALHSSSLP